jgi:hypothetical protein
MGFYQGFLLSILYSVLYRNYTEELHKRLLEFEEIGKRFCKFEAIEGKL